MTVVSVQELRRAWQAVEAGEFRAHPRPSPQSVSSVQPWVPSHQVLPVLGCHGHAGATTAATALATASDQRARVLETSNRSATGLAAAANAELGLSESGWVRSTRGTVVLERTNTVVATPNATPHPDDSGGPFELTVLDTGWEAGALLAADSWVSATVLEAPALVLVTTATVPGMRRLEAVLHMVGDTSARVVLVTGPRRRRWPREVTHSRGPLSQAVDTAGALLELPHDPALATNGLDDCPLPAGVLATASQVLQLLGLDAGSHPTKGTT
ncbi:hypothetical protein [Ornithinimicrobium murale]|uniref:hypothetical protein n=1 Tax=Ornithinimicrobium murale TaxID=1050153 RepID=UPI000E0D81C1|nr:hypothetical protein [Ornithinimicrobium murale]